MKTVKLMSQKDLDSLVRDLKLNKRQSEILSSRLQKHGYLKSDTRISTYRGRECFLANFFKEDKDNKMVFCSNIEEVMKSLKIVYSSSDWRLFIDSSKFSLKAVLLHIGNVYPSVPVAYSKTLKESYDSINIILKFISYEKYKWKLCADFKVIAFLLGLQKGYTKYSCFICEWDSRPKALHYNKKEWPLRNNFTPGLKNISSMPLIDPRSVIIPPLHLKLGLVKSFIKTICKKSQNFSAFMASKFPSLSKAKILEGVLTGPQIRKLFLHNSLIDHLNDDETSCWNNIKDVCSNFLGMI